MFYRRKVILALLQAFGGELEKIRLQKLLFLLTNRQAKPDYDFVPYKLGCFSYSANADLTAMVTRGMVAESEYYFSKTDPINYLQQLKENDRLAVMEVKRLYGEMDADTLMKHTYTNFPYTAIKSVKAEKILGPLELERVNSARPQGSTTILFTIGYEGISPEEYLNRLIKNDVRVLVDVRNNPLSMKYGFSKGQLKRFCENLGIQYVHFPEVGIQSDQRRELHTQTDYDVLFADYRANSLPQTGSTQEAILHLLQRNHRIALTCFEANICQCHRKHLAEAIAALPGFGYEVKHI